MKYKSCSHVQVSGWSQTGEEQKEGKEAQTKRGRIATNTHVVPKEHIKG